MTWLSRLFGKPKTDAAQTQTVSPAQGIQASQPEAIPLAQTPATAADPALAAQHPSELEPASKPIVTPEPVEPAPSDDTFPDALGGEDEAEDPEDPNDADPTIGRYAPLDETSLDGADLQAKRAEVEQLALSGPHKVGPADSAGPGSLLEALMRLEAEGRVVSRVCDDAESGFYILYEPSPIQT